MFYNALVHHTYSSVACFAIHAFLSFRFPTLSRVFSNELHTSTATGDPHSNLGVPHFGIQLTNDSLFANDGSTHLYHFRPDQPEISVFYAEAQTRTDVARRQNKKHTFRSSKGNKKDPPGGGAGASSRSSKGDSSKEASYKGSSSRTSAKGSSSKVSSSGGSSSKRHTSHHHLGRQSSAGDIQKKHTQPRAPQMKPLPAECKRLNLAYGIASGEDETECLLDLVALGAVINALHEAYYFCDSTGVRNQWLANRCPTPYARPVEPMCVMLPG